MKYNFVLLAPVNEPAVACMIAQPETTLAVRDDQQEQVAEATAAAAGVGTQNGVRCCPACMFRDRPRGTSKCLPLYICKGRCIKSPLLSVQIKPTKPRPPPSMEVKPHFPNPDPYGDYNDDGDYSCHGDDDDGGDYNHDDHNDTLGDLQNIIDTLGD